jgi:DNA repair protein RecN (Recombination protein N)
MINHISVSNYALIENLELSIGDGLNIITGETGAGKSIILGAIGLCLGKRADSNVLNDKSKKCIVEITIEIKDKRLESYFQESDIDFQEETIVRREISSTGRSRSFVNDTPVNLDALNYIGTRLIDIHSQKDTLLLNNSAYQLSLVDLLAKNLKERKAYSIAFADYKAKKKAKSNYLDKAQANVDLDYIRFLANELFESNLKNGEIESLESEIEISERAEEIQMKLAEADALLNRDTIGIFNSLIELKSQLNGISSINENYAELLKRVESCQIELSDIGSEIEIEASSVEVNQEKLLEQQERYNLLQNLLQKHHVNTAEALLEKQADYDTQIFEIENRTVELDRLDKELIESEAKAKKVGEKLSASRKAVVPKLEKEINSICKLLNFSSPNFKFKLKESQTINANGLDDIDLLFSSNRGHSPKSLVKAASGGELSRVMLALKSILAQSKGLSTIIFDEIDTGVSGDTAAKVAKILKEMGSNLQVIAITHLPQIAASGNQHFKVEKKEAKGRTHTSIVQLDKDQKIAAIAQMLSSANPTKAALDNAKELIAVS